MSNENPAIGGAEEDEEEDLVDPLDTLKEECGLEKECEKYRGILDECAARVNSRTSTTETCHEEMIDFIHCIDHCVSKTLFSKLK